MRIFLFFIVVAVAVASGFVFYPHAPLNALLLGAVAYLVIEVSRLRQRISRLEQQSSPPQATVDQSPPPTPSPNVLQPEEAPISTSKPPPAATPEIPPPIKEPPQEPRKPRLVASPLAPLIRFITGGNPVLKIGLVVLFFGVAFLLKYAAQRDLLPIELRLAGVALAGVLMLLLGGRLRHGHPGYGLSLEGGGIGVLYLVVFAAAKLYALVPMVLALGIMIGLVALSGILAVLQESKGLAVSGAIGGYLAPVLMSTGGGNHVLLFSYYALLGSGILGIAWFKAWRELNLVGLVFTFGLFSLWSAISYTPDLFASTEPFLLLFFVMYCLIAILFALRQPLQLRGFIDGPQVFGLPIVFSSLQAYLVHDFRYGMACSALALGGWYIILTRLLWNRFQGEMRLLIEVFLALGVVFTSLAIPLGLDPHWTTASWALEGAAMIWVGVRQHRLAARIFGLILQTGAAIAFLDQTALPPDSLVFANRLYLSCALIGIAALFSSYWFDQLGAKRRAWEGIVPLVLLAWGLIWWYAGGLLDLERHWQLRHPETLFLLYACLTTVVLAWLCRRYAWQRLSLALLLLLPIMILVYAALLVDGSLLLQHIGWLAWPLAFCLQYALLKGYGHLWPNRATSPAHCLGLWLLIAALTTELAFRVDRIHGLTDAWSAAVWGLVPTLLLYLLEFQGKRVSWPVARHLSLYQGIGTDIPVFALLLGCFASFSLSGNPAPLPYIPLINPLELIELAILVLATLRWLRRKTVWPPKGQPVVVGLLAFAWLNVVTGRSVHFFTGTSYSINDLFASHVFQAAIAALWATLALSLTVLGARKEQRKTWVVGAVLLGLVVLKLFMIDLSGTGSIGRIISFLVVGLLMLVIGYFAPLPPQSTNEPPHAR